MTNWDLYQKFINAEGSDRRKQSINRMRRKIEWESVDLAACKEVEIDGFPDRLILHRADNRNQKNFSTLPGHPIALGQIVRWQDDRQNITHWIVTEVDFDDEIVANGRMERCNRQLSWQNPETLAIVTRWCTADKPYFSNLESGKVITTSKREYKIQIPYDEETSLLDLDKRFLMEKIAGKAKAYKITSVDTMTERYDENGENKGFLVINIQQDDFNPETDDPDRMIADYIAPPAAQPGAGNCEIVPDTDAALIIGGTYRTFRARFLDTDGAPITEHEGNAIVPVWSLEFADEAHRSQFDQRIVDGGYGIEIRAANDYGLEHVIVRLRLTDDSNTFSRALDIIVKAGW